MTTVTVTGVGACPVGEGGLRAAVRHARTHAVNDASQRAADYAAAIGMHVFGVMSLKALSSPPPEDADHVIDEVEASFRLARGAAR